MKDVSMTAVAIVTALLAGCNSESATKGATPAPQDDLIEVIEPTPKEPVDAEPPTEPEVKPEPLPQIPAPEPEPSKAASTIFVPEGISTITQQPYSGTVIRDGDAYLRYDSGVTDFHDFKLPEWTVEYKYQPYLEVLITNGTETLCARYSWKLKGFGYARPQCLWSDTRATLPLDDMKSAYYGYSVVESRVWVNGVVGLGVGVSF